MKTFHSGNLKTLLLCVFSLCLTLLGLTLFSCKRDDKPVDPCRDAKLFEADFTIKEHVGDSLVETDVVLAYNLVTIEAKEDYDSYEWSIGGDTRTYTSKSVTLRYLDDAVGPIDVSLVAKKKPSECLPTDPGIDVVRKRFTVLPWGQAPIIGRYRGYFGSDNARRDPQVVEVAFVPEEVMPGSPPSAFGSFVFININKGCNPDAKHLTRTLERGARTIWYQGFVGEGCLNPSAWFGLQGNDTLKVSFSQKVNANVETRTADTFTGTRVR